MLAFSFNVWTIFLRVVEKTYLLLCLVLLLSGSLLPPRNRAFRCVSPSISAGPFFFLLKIDLTTITERVPLQAQVMNWPRVIRISKTGFVVFCSHERFVASKAEVLRKVSKHSTLEGKRSLFVLQIYFKTASL